MKIPKNIVLVFTFIAATFGLSISTLQAHKVVCMKGAVTGQDQLLKCSYHVGVSAEQGQYFCYIKFDIDGSNIQWIDLMRQPTGIKAQYMVNTLAGHAVTTINGVMMNGAVYFKNPGNIVRTLALPGVTMDQIGAALGTTPIKYGSASAANVQQAVSNLGTISNCKE